MSWSETLIAMTPKTYQRPTMKIIELFVTDLQAWRITFDQAGFDRIMIAMRGRPIYRVKLLPSEGWRLAQWNYEIDRPERDEIKISLPNLLPVNQNQTTAVGLQRALVRTLAHEARHSCQPQGMSQRGETIIFTGATLLAVAGIFIGAAWLSWPLLTSIHGFFPGLANLCKIAILTLGAVVSATVVVGLGPVCAYSLSWTERDADAFASQAVRDPAWLDLVSVERIPYAEAKKFRSQQ